MFDFEEALLEEYGFEVERISPHVAPAYFNWSADVRLNRRIIISNSEMELFKIMDDEEITFLYDGGDILIDAYGYDLLQGALLELWGIE